MKTVHAIFENGVFRPIQAVELPEHCEVAFEPRMVGAADDRAHRSRIASMLASRFDSGRSDISERHNEHQP